MPAHVRYDLPEGDLRVIAETETAFIIAVNVPKTVIGRNRQLLTMLLEAVAGETGTGGEDV
jgi:hypothetical protein